MKAVYFTTFGDEAVLQIGDVSEPELGPDQVLIGASYAAVNPVDWKIREGYLRDFLPHHLPIVPGWDVAGEVVAVGDDVREFGVGDRVAAYARGSEVRNGTYAERVAVSRQQVAIVPESMSLQHAAAMPTVALTAWQALHEIAQVGRGDRVLIHAGSGGVGSYAIQLAKRAGATVVATCSTINHAYVRKLGADHAVDYRDPELRRALETLAPEGFDTILDAVGGTTLELSLSIARRTTGLVVSLTEVPDPERVERHGVRSQFLFVEPNGAQLASVLKLVAEGQVTPSALTVRPVDEVAAAMRASRQGHTRGKVVLDLRFEP